MGWNPTQLRKCFCFLPTGFARSSAPLRWATTPATGWTCWCGRGAELKRRNAIPFAGYVTDLDGRRAPWMFDSLPYRNDAATVYRRLIRSLPTRHGVVGWPPVTRVFPQ